MRAMVVLALVILLAVLAAPVFAQDSQIPTFDVWLTALSGPLVAAAVGFILSWVVEWFPAYEKLAPRVKRIVFLAVCLVVPIVAVTVRGLLGYASWTFDPLYWHALWNGFIAYGVGNLAHIRKLPAA